MSILYSGTPAMKTDFTATGKRTFKGSVKDGNTGVTRFFLGNFYDNRKQVGLMLFRTTSTWTASVSPG